MPSHPKTVPDFLTHANPGANGGRPDALLLKDNVIIGGLRFYTSKSYPLNDASGQYAEIMHFAHHVLAKIFRGLFCALTDRGRQHPAVVCGEIL